MSQVGFSRNRCWDGVWCVGYLLETNICGKEEKEERFLWGKMVKLQCRPTAALWRALEQKWPIRVVSAWAEIAGPLSLTTIGLWMWVPQEEHALGQVSPLLLRQVGHGNTRIPSQHLKTKTFPLLPQVNFLYVQDNERDWEDSNDQNAIIGNSLVVQWWGLGAFTDGARVWSLVGELRSCKPRGEAKKKKKQL